MPHDFDALYVRRDDKNKSLIQIDVATMMEACIEPYPIIMQTLQSLRQEEELKITVPFEPKPLMLQLSRMGFYFCIERQGPELFILNIRISK